MIKKKEEIRPSTYDQDYWIWAHSPQERGVPEDPQKRIALRQRQLEEGKLRSGKWLVFVSQKYVDEAWEKIQRATEAGKLGTSAKVSTAKPSPLNPDPAKRSRVICVYTRDWTDRADVMRVREELRKLGVTKKISYKSDEDTLRKKYAVTGHERIAKYWA